MIPAGHLPEAGACLAKIPAGHPSEAVACPAILEAVACLESRSAILETRSAILEEHPHGEPHISLQLTTRPPKLDKMVS